MKFSKKAKQTLLMLGVLFALLQAHAAGGNGGVGDGGGEQLTSELNPWMTGPLSIEYCIERSQDFPQGKQTLSDLVAESFANWQTFFAKYKMNGAFQTNLPEFPNVVLPSSVKEVAQCTSPKTQIRFVFGVMNSEIQKYKSFYAERVIGFAHRTNYNKNTFQGSGVVWIAPHNSYEEHTGALTNVFPDWTWKLSLKHQILHEIGHVFGMQHDSTWVMDSEVMHTQLWETLRHQMIPGESNEMVPLGSIETPFMVFDPLSGASDVSTCAGFNCRLAPEMPKAIQKALSIALQPNRINPDVRIRFSQFSRPNPTPGNEPDAPTFQMTISIPEFGIEKTIDIRAQALTTELVPRLYISGAYNLDAAWLRRVNRGNFTALLDGNGTSLPLSINVEAKLIKISFYDSSANTWTDWFALSAPYVRDPNPSH